MPGPQASLLPGIPSVISIHCLWLQFLELIFLPREASLAGFPICFQFQILFGIKSSLGVSLTPSACNSHSNLGQASHLLWTEEGCLCPPPRDGQQGPKSFRRIILGKVNFATVSTVPPMSCDPILFLSPLVA